MNPSFFEGKDFTRAHRALHFLKEISAARTLLFLIENMGRHAAAPFIFGWKMASPHCVLNGNSEYDQNFCSKHKGCEPPKAPLDQSSRIPILYMLYDSDIATGRGSAKVFGFEVVKGSTIEADTYLGHHRRSLGDRWRMLKSTNGGTIAAA